MALPAFPLSAQPGRPGSYPRRALVCVVGLSPQVVTETLYALAHDDEDRFVAGELHIITTAAGAQRVRAELLDSGVLEQLQLQIGASRLSTQVHVVRRDGVEVDDIDSLGDDTALGDTVLSVMRPLAADPACAIHASLAGGRKSMGFYIGYVLSLIGRAQDRLSHVLVNAPFEGRSDFFYPPVPAQELQLPGGGQVSTAQAQLVLAPVAFVRMSDGLPDQLRREDIGFTDLVQRAQLAMAPFRVELAPATREVRIAGMAPVVLEPALFAWYLYFGIRRQRALKESEALIAPGMLRVHRYPSRNIGLDPALMHHICQRVGVETQPAQLTPEELRTRVSPINKTLQRSFGAELARHLVIVGPADRATRDGQYGLLGLQPAQIHVL
ncbi:MAG: CRISPR-associated ring nuclease Csm6 [Roseateles sp.]